MAFYKKYKLTSGSSKWLVMYRDPNGKQHKKKGFKTKSEASLFYANEALKFAQHGYTSNSSVTYREVYEKYFIGPYTASHEESTVVKVKTDFRLHILPVLGNYPISKITTADCQKAVNTWSHSRKNVAKVAQYAAMIFKEAIVQRFIYENPMSQGLIKYPRMDNKKSVKGFDQDEFKQFIIALKSEYRNKLPRAFAFLWLTAFTGCRKQEVSALEWGNVNLDDGYIYIHQAVKRNLNNGLMIGSTKNKSSIRYIPIDNKTIEVLEEWKTIQKQELAAQQLPFKGNHQLLFTNRNGGLLTPSKPGLWLKRLEHKYNLPNVTPHGLRHTYGTLLLISGTPITEVSSLMGHSSIETTMKVYIDLHPVKDHSSVNRLAAIIEE